MELINSILAIAEAWWPIVTQIVTVAAMIAVMTPSKSDDRIVQFILDIINKLGLNIGKAKNADSE